MTNVMIVIEKARMKLRESCRRRCFKARGMDVLRNVTVSLPHSRDGRTSHISLSGSLSILFGSIVLLSLSSTAFGEDRVSESISLQTEIVTIPKAIKYGTLQYPRRALSKGEEGWVYLNFFVDTDGNPYQISVADRSGSPLFEAAAIKALKGTTFQPAVYNGRKIDHEHYMQYTFIMDDKRALYADSFRRRFYEVVNSISSKTKTKAEDGLEILRERRRTLHEDAMYWTAKYYFDQEWGTVSAQLNSVSRAIGHDKARRFMDANLLQKLLWSKLLLQLRQKKYVSALTTLDRFDELNGVDDALRQQAAKYRTAIDELRYSTKTILVSGTLNSKGAWSHELIRNRFSVADVEGSIGEFNLNCQRDRLRFEYEPDLEYSFNDSSGTCRVSVTGDPGTSFSFIQR